MTTRCHTEWGRGEQIVVRDEVGWSLRIVEPRSAVRGGIVVFPEARGATKRVEELATGLADEGWLAAVPERRSNSWTHRRLERVPLEGILAAVDATADWLAGQGVDSDRIGGIDARLGGAVALLVAARRELGAVVSVNGTGIVQPVSPRWPSLVQAAPELRCPWLGVYDRTAGIPEVAIQKLREAVELAEMATDLVHLTGGGIRSGGISGGGIHTGSGGGFGRSVAPEAWSRTLNWFDSHLR